MKKTFKMTDVDCANCARKMQEAICKLDGVTDATVNFLTQKLTIDADDARFDEIVKQAQLKAGEIMSTAAHPCSGGAADCRGSAPSGGAVAAAPLSGPLPGHRLGRAVEGRAQHCPRPSL